MRKNAKKRLLRDYSDDENRRHSKANLTRKSRQGKILANHETWFQENAQSAFPHVSRHGAKMRPTVYFIDGIAFATRSIKTDQMRGIKLADIRVSLLHATNDNGELLPFIRMQSVAYDCMSIGTLLAACGVDKIDYFFSQYYGGYCIRFESWRMLCQEFFEFQQFGV